MLSVVGPSQYTHHVFASSTSILSVLGLRLVLEHLLLRVRQDFVFTQSAKKHIFLGRNGVRMYVLDFTQPVAK